MKLQNFSLPKIAVVEDDEDLLDNVMSYLQIHEFDVWGVTNAEAFYKQLLKSPVDVVILDINLPSEDGFCVAEHLQDMPEMIVIIISARRSVDDRLKALNLGAERYLVKPVDFNELVANIHAAMRGRIQKSSHQWLLHQNEWLLISPNEQHITLTASEYFFLRILILAEGKVVSRKEIMEKLFDGKDYVNINDRLDTLVARLRRKAQKELSISLPIKTITATGYVFTAPAKLFA